MDAIQRDELRGHLETLVLSVLGTGEMHGYEVLRRLCLRGEGMLEMKEGSLYPVLYRLEAAGHIRGRWESEHAVRRGPRRRVYRLTASGTRELDARRDRWRAFVRILNPIVEHGA